MRKIFSLMLCLAAGYNVFAQTPTGYSNFSQQTNRLNALAKAYPQLAKLRSLTKTTGGKDIWQLTLGSGDVDAKPALLIVGGTEGKHLLGTELAISFAEDLLKSSGSDSIKVLLSKTTFYIFPNMSPDAMEQYFAPLRYERQGNASTTDDDRDGRLDEDGYEDLDGNGKITWMRVESPVGTYKINPDDPRSLIKADITKGERGQFELYTEGRDNDNDGIFNEDGEGGVWFNKNFTFKHPSFTQGSGEFPVSEKETRALLDYLFDRSNIYAVVSFGTNNNLSSPVTYNAAAASQTITSGWLEPDTKINAMVSDMYNKETGLKDAPKTNAAGGDFYSWAYFHYGRYSFSTPGWWVPKTKPDSTKNEKAFTNDDPVAAYLRWAAHQNITNTFTEWKTIQHPDFPGRKVEVGGLDPFVLITPPYNLTADIAKKNNRFLVKLASFQPEIDMINVKTEKLGGNVTRITLDLINKGAFPSHSKLGERNYWVKRIRVKVNTNGSQAIVSGKKLQTLNSIAGYGTEKLTWLVKGSGKISIEAGSPTTGTKSVDITL